MCERSAVAPRQQFGRRGQQFILVTTAITKRPAAGRDVATLLDERTGHPARTRRRGSEGRRKGVDRVGERGKVTGGKEREEGDEGKEVWGDEWMKRKGK